VDALSAGTNNAGIVIDEATGTKNTNLLIGTTTIPTGSYSIYNSSTDQNYFAGNLGIGKSSPSTTLDVGGHHLRRVPQDQGRHLRLGRPLRLGDHDAQEHHDDLRGSVTIARKVGVGTGNLLIVDAKGLVYDGTNKGWASASPLPRLRSKCKEPSSGSALTVTGLKSCGGVVTNTAGVTSCSSDARLKDIQGAFTRGMDAIRLISPQTYAWKAGTNLYDGGTPLLRLHRPKRPECPAGSGQHRAPTGISRFTS